MVRLQTTDREFEIAAWKVGNLSDYNDRLERAARRVDEMNREHDTAPLIIYEAALMKSGRPVSEVREMVRSFRDTWEEEDEEPLTIPRVSTIMSVEGSGWFFGDEDIRRLTGQLLGQFQHRVAQYNYLDEREVLKRWADGYDTRLFIRRGIYSTEPIAGVISGFDLKMMQHMRYIAGADTAVPTPELGEALSSLGLYPDEDESLLATVESLALRMDLPAPIAAELLEDLARESFTDYPEPPADLFADPDSEEPEGEAEAEGGSAPEEKPVKKMTAEERAARRAARRGKAAPEGEKDPATGEEPTKAQSAQSGDAPTGAEQTGRSPESPERGRGGDAPGKTDEPEGEGRNA